MALWTAGYFTLHAVIGYKAFAYSAQYAWEGNQRRWPYAVTLNALVFGPVWVLVVRGFAPLIRPHSAVRIHDSVLLGSADVSCVLVGDPVLDHAVADFGTHVDCGDRGAEQEARRLLRVAPVVADADLGSSGTSSL